MNRRIMLCLLAVCLLLSLPLAAFAQEEIQPAVTNNLNYQEYAYGRWSEPISSYLVDCGENGIMRVEYTGYAVAIEMYDLDFNITSQKLLDMELEIFGGFGTYDGYYFLVFGQTNLEEDNSKEVIRVVKYSNTWERLGAASLYGANTTVPFDAGSLRMVGYGDKLYIRTAHEMYASSDGLNHQANVTLSISIPDMRITDQFTGVMNASYGYVSHSFNQFIAVDGNTLVAADHGDAYPRSAVIIKYKQAAGGETFVSGMYSPCTAVDTLIYYGGIGANDTGAAMGAFEVTDSSYLIAGNTVVQDGSVDLRYGQRNIYVSATPKDDFSKAATQIHYLTNYADGSGIDVSVPHMIRISGSRYLVLWREGTNTLRYAFVDGNGVAVSQISSGEGNISDCKPIVVGDRVVWYVTSGGGPVFYSIDLTTGALTHTELCHYGHNYYCASQLDPTVNTSGYMNLVCRNCGAEATRELPMLNPVDYVCSPYRQPGCTSSGWDAYKIEVYGVSYTFYSYLPALGHDYVNSVCSRCGEKENHVHSYTVSEQPATCTEPSCRVYTCQCGDSYMESAGEPLGHDWDGGIVSVEPTVDAEGVRLYTCSRCGQTKTEPIDKLVPEFTGAACPDFRFTAMDGSYVTKDTDAGKLRLFIFYRNTCPNSMMTIRQLSGQNWVSDENIGIFAVNVDNADASALQSFADEYANGGRDIRFCTNAGSYLWTFLRAVGDNANSVTLPVSFLVDTEGTIRWYNTSYTTPEQYRTAMLPYLPQEDPCKNGHTFSLLVMRVEPTHTETGMLQWSCSVCENYGMEELPMLNDRDYTVTRIQESLCDQPGIDSYIWNNRQFGEVEIRVSLPRPPHTYIAEVTVQPTEQQQGMIEGKCRDCVATIRMTLPRLGSFGYTYAQTLAPTCQAEGKGVYTFNDTSCGVFEFPVTLPKTEHSYTESVTAPTCTEQGFTTYTCAMCANVYVGDYVDASGHDWDTGTVTAAPDEYNAGVRTYTCNTCGATREEEIPPQEHVHSYTAVVTAPTCTEQGYTTYTCKCTDSYRADYVQATGHDYQTSVTAPTCTGQGFTTYTCACGDSYAADYTDALGHMWDSGVVTREPTAVSTGVRTYTCTVCRETEEEEIPMLPDTGTACPGYSFPAMDGSTVTNDTDAGKVKLMIFYRTTCPNSINTILDLVTGSWIADPNLSVIAVNCDGAPISELKEFADAYANGGAHMTFCTDKQGAMWDILSSADYSADSVTLPVCIVIDADGNVGSYTTAFAGQETLCDMVAEYVGGMDDPCCFGHSYRIDVLDAPTLEAEGRYRGYCRYCDLAEVRTLPALNGTDYTVTHVRDATCSSFGVAEYVWNDNTYGRVSFQVSLPLLEHNWQGTVIVAPTADAGGEIEGICTGCSSTFWLGIPQLNEWTYTYAVEKEATCMEAGEASYTYSYEEYGTYVFFVALEKTAHSYGPWYMSGSTPPCQGGEQRRDCSVCGYSETGAGELGAHSYTPVVTAPNCTELGYTTYTCICGAHYVADYVSATGHVWDNGVADMQQGVICYTCQVCGVKNTVSAGGGKPDHSQTEYAASGDLSVAAPTKQDIIKMWKTVTTPADTFVTAPSVTAPHSIGKLSDSLLESGITYLNYIRFVAKLPQVHLSDELNESAQYGAVLLAAVNYLSHTPHQPSDMADAFYEMGYAATKSSNISMRGGFWDTNYLQSSLSGCISDSGDNNLATVGHRRWLLNPKLLNVGFGYAQSTSGRDYIVTKVFDQSGADVVYDFISWPASGYFPTNLFDNSTPWSVTLNPQLYQRPDLDEVKVVLTRQSDGKTWTFDAQTGAPTTAYNAYMTVDNSGYGVSNCIIFSPGSQNVDAYMGVFTVEVTGLYDWDGNSKSIKYQVEFFDIDGCEEHIYTAVVTAPTCTGQGYTTYTCECGDSYTDSYTDATGHHWGQWVETKPATQTQEGKRQRVCTVCSEIQTETIPATGRVNPFTDVKADRFEDAILWAYYSGITTGTTATAFSPENTCTRKQIVTFLWRAAGEPEPASMVNPFTDVKADRFEKAILWAYYEGITTGTTSTTFSPESTCTRKQIVTFLWRYHAEPEPASTVNPFTDVKADRFEKAILWAYYEGITTGTTNTTFSPESPCTRKQIVTFLYRDLAE